jgi:uncharacterized protein involved in outer membrane biogenesis
MNHIRAAIKRTARLGHSRWLRISALIVLGAFAIFTLGGFFGIPLLLHHMVSTSLSASLHRQASAGTIRFNPYTLRLNVEAVRINDRGSAEPFAEIGQLRLKASWSSLYRLAPVIQEVTIDRPTLHAVRTPDQRFNFSDLIEGQTKSPPASQAPPRRWRFAVSNIRINDGQVRFDDEAFHQHHTVERLAVGIPFIANLPADVEIYVQPLVRMVVDGSPFRIAGITKPFAAVPDSILDLRLRNFDLTRVAAYLTHGIPIRIPRGTLSTKLQVHFLQPHTGPVVKVAGEIKVDALDVRDSANAPLVSFKSATIPLRQLDPLNRVLVLGVVAVDGLHSGLVRNPGGKTNFSALTSVFAGGKQAAAAHQPGASFYLFVRSFDLTNGEFNVRDNTTASPVTLGFKAVHIGFKNFDTHKSAKPVPFQFQAGIGQGAAKLNGTLDLAHLRVVATAALDKIDLVPLQPFAQPFWVGTLASGKLSVQANLQAGLAGRFNALIKPGTISLDNIEIRAPGDIQKPVQFDHFTVVLNQVDLNARRADVKEVRLDKLRLSAQRARDGSVSLTSFLHPASQPQPTMAAPPPKVAPLQQTQTQAEVQHQPVMSIPASQAVSGAGQPGWQYQIGSVAIENADTDIEDDSGPGPIHIEAAPLNIHLKNVSSDLSKTFSLEADSDLKPQGGFKAEGTAAINPLAAKMHIVTTRIDLTPAGMYLGGRVNAKITRAALTINGDVELARAPDNLHVVYRGDALIGNVRVHDATTNQRFLRWNALRASAIHAEIGRGRPRINIGELTLSDFYTRLVLSSEGKLNLRDITAGSKSAQRAPAVKSAAETSTKAAPAQAEPPFPADLRLGRIVLQGGAVNYTDNFIKPNYSANLTHIAGRIGAFSTSSTRPAEVDLQGELNSSAPIDITGSINPLAPEAFVDIKGKADGVELTNLSPYSTKYTGYPITKGTLNFDVHYLLQNRQLTATNHLFFSQLTFGEKVNSPNAINLPIAMAVDLLKNPRGEIDLTVPVSGSLNDPHFSIGALILKVLTNLVLKVVSSPFSVLASIAGGSHQQLNQVEFPAGQATLTPESINRLSTLAKAMQARPALRLTISGRVDPAVDRIGLRDAKVERLIRKQKVYELRERGEIADASSITLAPDEYDKYLKLAYKKADFDKPRNFLGLDKSLPPDQMKHLLLANTKVTDDDLKRLATDRAVAVRKYLGKQINPSRLAVATPNINKEGKDKGARVDLSLQ